MILYNSAVSGNCWKVRQMLAHLGIRADRGYAPTPEEIDARAGSERGLDGSSRAALGALELRELDVVDRTNRRATIGELNPALRVPTLVLDDGRALPESNAIITYLAEGTPYLPSDRYDRARAIGWMMFEQYEIEPNLAVARFWRLFGVDAPPEQHAAKQAAGRKGLEALERGLAGREWLVGGRYSVADISLYGYTHVAHEGGFTLDEYPWIRAWLDRVAAQPGHLRITD